MALRDLEQRSHQDMVEVFEQYKKYYERYGDLLITEQEDEAIRRHAAELQGTYDYYRVLLFELKNCIRNYHSARTNLKANIHSSVRKMRRMDKKSRD